MTWRPDYTTLADLKSYLRVSDTADDVQIGLAVTAASRAIDRTCRRQFGQTTSQARIYTPRVGSGGRFVVDVDDVQDVTGILVATDTAGDGGFATAVTDYRIGPRNAGVDGYPYTRLSLISAPLVADSVRVTALWGWTAVPATIREACLVQASRFHARRDSPFGIAGSPEAGSEMRLMSKVDVDVAVMLRPYTRRWWAL